MGSLDGEKAAPGDSAAFSHQPTGKGQESALKSEPESIVQVKNGFAPGLLGQLHAYFKLIAPYPNDTVAFVGAVSWLAGLCGRAYNVSGTGLNQYILMLAPTGVGKDAIASGSSKLTAALLRTCPSIIGFTGPGEISSGPALIKAFAASKTGSLRCNLGEIGKLLQMMADPKGPAHLKTLNRAMLQFYTKSGFGEVFDPMAYSDVKNNVAALPSPALTISGESTPDVFYESLTPGHFSDGTASRFLILEDNSPKPYKNKDHSTYRPSASFLSKLNDLAAHCLGVSHRGEVHNVPFAAEAEAEFDSFDRWTVDYVNAANSEVGKQLRNRDSLKAVRLAGLRAVGENYLNPIITLDNILWASRLVAAQTDHLIAKFENHETGEQAGNDSLQVAYMKRVIAELFVADSDKAEKYGVNTHFLNHGVIEYAYIWRRLATLKPFQPNPKQSIKATIQLMIDSGWLAHTPNSLKVEIGTRANCYMMANTAEFANCECVKDKMQFISSYLALVRL